MEVSISSSRRAGVAAFAKFRSKNISMVEDFARSCILINTLPVERVKIVTEDRGSALATDIVNQANILGEFWISQRNEEQYEEFFAYFDLGLPLAYAYDNDMVEISPEAKEVISETFAGLLEIFGVPDLGYTDLSQLLEGETEDSQVEEDDSSSGPTSEADELAKWHKLFESGVITEEEFTQKKKQILGI